MPIDREEISRLTELYGGKWGINHTRRLLALVAEVGRGLEYDEEIVWLAAHLHDWGAYAPWSQAGVDHALRSRQVAAEFLSEQGYPAARSDRVLDCIQFHHSSAEQTSLEALLLGDADALDFLGVIGVLRDFAKQPKDLRAGFEMSQKRQARLPQNLHFERSRQIAAQRVAEMDALYTALESESWGYF